MYLSNWEALKNVIEFMLKFNVRLSWELLFIHFFLPYFDFGKHYLIIFNNSILDIWMWDIEEIRKHSLHYQPRKEILSKEVLALIF